MTDTNNPNEIARRALKRMVRERVSPTPENYQAYYAEIARQPAAESPPEPPLPAELAAHLARFIESVRPALGNEDRVASEMFGALRAALHETPPHASKLQSALAELDHPVRTAAEEQMEIKNSLLKLLRLIIGNIGELSLDDTWLKGQVDGLLAVITPPLTLRHLDDMAERLRDVIAKQSEARRQSIKAQEEMREMLSAFIERLAAMSRSSTDFQSALERDAIAIERASRIEDLVPLLKDVIGATRAMAEETAASHQELQTLQEKMRSTEAQLVRLHLELDSASMLARHDPLTHALNRRGLDEALAREIASMRRRDAPLSVSLLDIDNFKKLNDRLGHDVGDNALAHLARVARANLRLTDVLARYGGEEFVILMPDTSLDAGIDTIIRLQRELTKTFFLAGNEKVLITFSAGVAQLSAEESGIDAIRRADRAMYLAKRSGKNRVMSG